MASSCCSSTEQPPKVNEHSFKQAARKIKEGIQLTCQVLQHEQVLAPEQSAEINDIYKGISYCYEGVASIKAWCEGITERLNALASMISRSRKRKERSQSVPEMNPEGYVDLAGSSADEDDKRPVRGTSDAGKLPNSKQMQEISSREQSLQDLGQSSTSIVKLKEEMKEQTDGRKFRVATTSNMDDRTAYETRKDLAHHLISMSENKAKLPHRMPKSS